MSSIEGQHLADEIEPRHDVQDTVVFLVPADVDRTKIRYFRLSLPAHAIGTRGFLPVRDPGQHDHGLLVGLYGNAEHVA